MSSKRLVLPGNLQEYQKKQSNSSQKPVKIMASKSFDPSTIRNSMMGISGGVSISPEDVDQYL